jgi:ABC-type phosphate transport system substrate-binding protein
MARVLRQACALAVLMVWLGAVCEAKHMAVVVDKANTQGGITAAELIKIFKFDNRKWPDGRNVTLVLLDPSSPDMQSVIEKLYHMEPDEVKATLTEHRSAVVIVTSEEQLLKLVESTPGAVGVVDVYSINGRINVLKVDGKLPLEQGYLLK